MSLKILHILHDEKFIDGAIDTFNSTSSINTYVTIDDVTPFVYIRSHALDVQIIEKDMILSFISTGGFNIVAFHTLTRDKYEIALNIPKHIKVFWLSWGYDLYEPWYDMPPIISLDLYKKDTKEYLGITNKKKFKRFVKNILYVTRYKEICKKNKIIQDEVNIQKKLLQRINYISTVLPYEYKLLFKIPEFNAEYIPFQYVNKNKLDTKRIDPNANKILVGNSATVTNNHLSVLKILKKRKITNECILPCSYGDNVYLHYLETKVQKYKQIYLLKDFIPLNKYVNIINTCRVGIFGHIRQQAIGNVILCMIRGCKVFLYKDSIAYKFFKERGCVVFSIEDDLSQNSVNQLLTEDEILINQTKIIEQFSFENVVSRLKDALQNTEKILR